MATKEQLDNFEQAFSMHVSGCRHCCECGKEYWDAYNSGYTWNEGEREALEGDPNTYHALNHSVGLIGIEGRTYVDGCTCWHKRAEQWIDAIDDHKLQLAEYFKRERNRLAREASNTPVI